MMVPEFFTKNKTVIIMVGRTELKNNQSWILHHDNEPTHTLMLVHEFFIKNKTVIMLQKPYSTDLAPATLKTPMKGKLFKRKAMIEEIKEKSKQELLALPKILNHWH